MVCSFILLKSPFSSEPFSAILKNSMPSQQPQHSLHCFNSLTSITRRHTLYLTVFIYCLISALDCKLQESKDYILSIPCSIFHYRLTCDILCININRRNECKKWHRLHMILKPVGKNTYRSECLSPVLKNDHKHFPAAPPTLPL